MLLVTDKEKKPERIGSAKLQAMESLGKGHRYGSTPGSKAEIRVEEASVTDGASTTPETVAAKEAVLSTIQQAAITYDPASLHIIEPHLSSPDKEIREAAVDGVMLLGDAAGAALLRQAAKQARNPAEAEELQTKAAYLELPPGRLFTPQKLQAMKSRREASQAGNIGTNKRVRKPSNPAPTLRGTRPDTQ